MINLMYMPSAITIFTAIGGGIIEHLNIMNIYNLLTEGITLSDCVHNGGAFTFELICFKTISFRRKLVSYFLCVLKMTIPLYLSCFPVLVFLFSFECDENLFSLMYSLFVTFINLLLIEIHDFIKFIFSFSP